VRCRIDAQFRVTAWSGLAQVKTIGASQRALRQCLASVCHNPTEEEAAMPRILVPLDGSQLAEAALPVAVRLGRELGAELVLVSIGPVPESAAQARDERAELRQMLTRVAHSLEGQVSVRTRLETLGDPARGILQVAHEEHIDLIVMATHGRSGLSEAVQGSTAAAVIRAGQAPVTLVRSAGGHPQQ
jgi:nucleotide-binding universal stress UspA family protein